MTKPANHAAMPNNNLRCWIMNDGKIGTLNQCLGLAEAVARQLSAQGQGQGQGQGLEITLKTLQPRLPWRRLPAKLWWSPLKAQSPRGDRLAPPWPDLIISCGRAAAAPTAEIRRLAEGSCVAVALQDPRIAAHHFDLVVVARHDRLRGAGVMVSEGALHRVTHAKLAEAKLDFAPILTGLPRPLVAVSLGGNNPHFRFDVGVAMKMAEYLVGLAKSGLGLAITPSRRTPNGPLAVLKTHLAEALPASSYFLWDGTGENPYFGLLAYADHVIVTSDSVSMMSEAAATGKPVHYFALPSRGVAKIIGKFTSPLRDRQSHGTPPRDRQSHGTPPRDRQSHGTQSHGTQKTAGKTGGKFSKFHQSFTELGIIKRIDDTATSLPVWHYTPLTESDRAATELIAILAARPKSDKA